MIKKLFRNRFVLLFDILSILLARVVAGIMFVDTVPFADGTYFYTFFAYLILAISMHFITGMYKIAWQYSGTSELIKFLGINILTVIILFILNEVMAHFGVISGAYRRINGGMTLISILSMLVIRLSEKEIFKAISTRQMGRTAVKSNATNRVLIVGAGDAARLIVRSFSDGFTANYEVVGFVDDDAAKKGKVFYGYKVLGGRENIVQICEKYAVDSIIMAIPSAYVKDRLDILKICSLTKCKVKTIPNISDILNSGDISVRDVRIEDLLERDPVKLDNDGITSLVKDRTVMVSGGGGSIGSELCRQIMRFSPKKLIIVDIYENNAYDIQMELNEEYPQNRPVVLIASVRDKVRLDEIFTEYKPNIVFHAAAHKHVPLMETSPGEAIKNNVFGTYNLALAADKHGVEKFVMISTDKAVNPTNIMGASKRLCEMIIQCMEKVSRTDFVAVRFGNVLGSNGSVIPLFERQIAKGGPVRVTHRDVTRFFMTIPEAAQLVIQAACYARGGEIFVLDMGNPVRIYDLAENLIRLSGHNPGVDIKIEIIGLRPGEKLYEELLMDQEGLESTENSKIFIGRPMSVEMDVLKENLELLKAAADSNDNDKIRDVMERAVPTYIRDNESFNNMHQQKKDKAKV